MNTIKVDRGAFKAWLERDPSREFVAVYGLWSCGCPLATYAREELGYPEASWASRILYPNERKETLSAPKWTKAFVDRFDASAVFPKTASAALEVLDNLP